MPMMHLTPDELARLHRDPPALGPGPARGAVLVVDLDAAGGSAALPSEASTLPAVVVGTSRAIVDAPFPDACDVVVPPGGDELGSIVGAVEAHPIAALTLATLLRRTVGRDVAAGLLAESACYGVLQAGEEFDRWRRATRRRAPRPSATPILAVRDGPELTITLQRPERRNALDVAMRDALAEQLQLVALDDSIERVTITGAGPAFCSGGDLDEFGSAPDPAVAHLVRLERSLGALLHAVADRVTVRLHGACRGSGIELAAFAGRVVADATVSIGLPEVAMGLIPGAGGTVSLPRRIGRHRTCRLALAGDTIDGATAQAWGLVDELTE